MDKSFEATPLEESVQLITPIKYSCICGYSTLDKSNFNKHMKRCRHRKTRLAEAPVPDLSPAGLALHEASPDSAPALRTPTPSPVARAPTLETAPTVSTPRQASCGSTPGLILSALALASAQSSSKPGPAQDPSAPAQRMHVCDQCGKSFKSKFGMQLHIKNIHTKTFRYECALCDSKFNQNRPFRYHCAKHLKMPIDKCNHCNRQFNSPGSLSRHLVVCLGNSNSKEFKCDQCSSSFAQKYRLTYHNKGKHGPKRYICEFCGKRYAWRSSLKEHTAVCLK